MTIKQATLRAAAILALLAGSASSMPAAVVRIVNETSRTIQAAVYYFESTAGAQYAYFRVQWTKRDGADVLELTSITDSNSSDGYTAVPDDHDSTETVLVIRVMEE